MRGLASVLFVLLILAQSDIAHGDRVLATTVVTVALSALLHGPSAAPVARRYALGIARLGECEAIQPVAEMPLHDGSSRTSSGG